MHKLAIVGAGQLGSRHLQALSKLSGENDIYVIDPLESSLETARQRFNEVCPQVFRGQVNYYQEINKLPAKLDVVIIATGSRERFDVLCRLLKHCTVDSVVLEKVVFHNLAYFEQAQELLRKTQTKAWVNCSRRMWTSYQKLKNMLEDEIIIEFIVNGSSWDIGCNAIHHLDLFSFLSKQEVTELNPAGLKQGFRESRRKGYLEFDGILTGSTAEGAYVRLSSSDAVLAEDMTINILCNTAKVEINESKQTVRVRREKSRWELEEFSLDILYQSQLSHLFVEKILTTGSCDLTPFSECIHNHKILIKALAAHLGYENKAVCAIT